MSKLKENKFLTEFKNFALKGNVVDMAVGVVIGGAFGKIVTSLVNDVIMPCVSMITGGVNFTEWKLIMKPEVLDAAGEVAEQAVSINYGNFLQLILDFFIVALSIFVVLKIMFHSRDKKLAAEKKAAEEAAAAKAAEPAPETELDVLNDIRALLRDSKKAE